MRYIIYLFFFVLQSSICSKNPTNKEKQHNINKNCQDIKCPPVDQPVCARVTSVNNKNSKTMYILMVNLCEIEYMKCHQGLQASIVDMKNCGHEEYQTLNKLIKDKGRKRSKRDTHSGIIKLDPKPLTKTIARNDDMTSLDTSGDIVFLDNKEAAAYPQPSGNHNGFLDTSLSDEMETVVPDVSSEMTTPPNEQDTAEFEDIPNPKNELPETDELPGTDKDFAEPYKVLPETKQDLPDIELSPESDEVLPVTEKELESSHVIGSTPAEPAASDKNSGNLSEGLEKNIKVTDKFISKDDTAQPRDQDQYQADCPTSCPSQDVMVCAKCQHGIYKTFMSVCHMRMFSCWFTDEQLELVSRYPCVMSAPFLSTKPDTNPKERISFPDDEDTILKFIYCREKGDPSYIEGKHNLIYSENSNVYPKCDFKNTNRKLRNMPVKREIYNTY